jgi:hypothetical protein
MGIKSLTPRGTATQWGELLQTPGTTIIFSDAAFGTSNQLLIPTEKYFKLSNVSGLVRISYKHYSDDANNTTYSRIHINGLAVGIQRSTSSGTSATPIIYTQDINVVKDDRISIYTYSGGSGTFVTVGQMTIGIIEPGAR